VPELQRRPDVLVEGSSLFAGGQLVLKTSLGAAYAGCDAPLWADVDCTVKHSGSIVLPGREEIMISAGIVIVDIAEPESHAQTVCFEYTLAEGQQTLESHCGQVRLRLKPLGGECFLIRHVSIKLAPQIGLPLQQTGQHSESSRNLLADMARRHSIGGFCDSGKLSMVEAGNLMREIGPVEEPVHTRRRASLVAAVAGAASASRREAKAGLAAAAVAAAEEAERASEWHGVLLPERARHVSLGESVALGEDSRRSEASEGEGLTGGETEPEEEAEMDADAWLASRRQSGLQGSVQRAVAMGVLLRAQTAARLAQKERERTAMAVLQRWVRPWVKRLHATPEPDAGQEAAEVSGEEEEGLRSAAPVHRSSDAMLAAWRLDEVKVTRRKRDRRPRDEHERQLERQRVYLERYGEEWQQQRHEHERELQRGWAHLNADGEEELPPWTGPYASPGPRRRPTGPLDNAITSWRQAGRATPPPRIIGHRFELSPQHLRPSTTTNAQVGLNESWPVSARAVDESSDAAARRRNARAAKAAGRALPVFVPAAVVELSSPFSSAVARVSERGALAPLPRAKLNNIDLFDPQHNYFQRGAEWAVEEGGGLACGGGGGGGGGGAPGSAYTPSSPRLPQVGGGGDNRSPLRPEPPRTSSPRLPMIGPSSRPASPTPMTPRAIKAAPKPPEPPLLPAEPCPLQSPRVRRAMQAAATENELVQRVWHKHRMAMAANPARSAGVEKRGWAPSASPRDRRAPSVISRAKLAPELERTLRSVLPASQVDEMLSAARDAATRAESRVGDWGQVGAMQVQPLVPSRQVTASAEDAPGSDWGLGGPAPPWALGEENCPV